MDHEKNMRHAIALASRVPEFPFGALIVDQDSGEILAEGWNQSSVNPTWHGEIVAINQLTETGNDEPGNHEPGNHEPGNHEPGNHWKERKLVLYSTAEPCAMCQAAIHWTGISSVVFGTSIRFLQQLGWKQIDITAEEVAARTPFHTCELIGGILAEQCNALFEKAIQQQAP